MTEDTLIFYTGYGMLSFRTLSHHNYMVIIMFTTSIGWFRCVGGFHYSNNGFSHVSVQCGGE